MRFLVSILTLTLWSGIAIGKDKIKAQAFDAEEAKKDKKELTFETTKEKAQYATGLKLEKGWVKKVKVQKVKIQAALPRHFDWREQGKLTPSKDQGNCGSCWAHSSTAVLQDVMALRGMGQISLSEQYLLSCNKEGWSCDGGFFAHDYHMALPMGGVPYAEFPYVARQVACKTNLSHPYHIASWAFLPSKDENTPPAIEAIKSAIYQYGPIGVAVGANDAFMSYSSGVFNQCDGTKPNHAVTLVGWDEDGQYFVMKNSWSPQWGDNGFMKIRYNCNYIGVAANYVVFNSPAPNPNPNPAPAPTPTPSPVPKCTPQPYANAGATAVSARVGQPVRLGTPARPGHTYHWESSAGPGRPLDTAIVTIRPWVSQIFTVYATTKCGTARSSVKVSVGR